MSDITYYARQPPRGPCRRRQGWPEQCTDITWYTLLGLLLTSGALT